MVSVISNHDSRLNPTGDIMKVAENFNQVVIRWPKIDFDGKNVLQMTKKSK